MEEEIELGYYQTVTVNSKFLAEENSVADAAGVAGVAVEKQDEKYAGRYGRRARQWLLGW